MSNSKDNKCLDEFALISIKSEGTNDNTCSGMRYKQCGARDIKHAIKITRGK